MRPEGAHSCIFTINIGACSGAGQAACQAHFATSSSPAPHDLRNQPSCRQCDGTPPAQASCCPATGVLVQRGTTCQLAHKQLPSQAAWGMRAAGTDRYLSSRVWTLSCGGRSPSASRRRASTARTAAASPASTSSCSAWAEGVTVAVESGPWPYCYHLGTGRRSRCCSMDAEAGLWSVVTRGPASAARSVRWALWRRAGGRGAARRAFR